MSRLDGPRAADARGPERRAGAGDDAPVKPPKRTRPKRAPSGRRRPSVRRRDEARRAIVLRPRVQRPTDLRRVVWDDQQAAMRAYAERIGVPSIRWHVEPKAAAGSARRSATGWLALVAEVRAGDLVALRRSWDRWSRDPAFHYTTIRDLPRDGRTLLLGRRAVRPKHGRERRCSTSASCSRGRSTRDQGRTVGTRLQQDASSRTVHGQPSASIGYSRTVADGEDSTSSWRTTTRMLCVRDRRSRSRGGRSRRPAKEAGRHRDVLLELPPQPPLPGKCATEGCGGSREARASHRSGHVVKAQATIAKRRLGGARERGRRLARAHGSTQRRGVCGVQRAATSAWAAERLPPVLRPVWRHTYVNVAEGRRRLAGPVIASGSRSSASIAQGPGSSRRLGIGIVD